MCGRWEEVDLESRTKRARRGGRHREEHYSYAMNAMCNHGSNYCRVMKVIFAEWRKKKVIVERDVGDH